MTEEAVKRALRYAFIGSVVFGSVPVVAHLIVAGAGASNFPEVAWIIDILFIATSVFVGGIMSGLRLAVVSGWRGERLLIFVPLLIVGLFAIALLYGLIIANAVSFKLWFLLSSAGALVLLGYVAYVIEVDEAALAWPRIGDMS